MYHRIAPLVIFSVLLLAVCCQVLPSAHMHAGMESEMGHAVLLTMNVPDVAPPWLSLALSWGVFALAALLASKTGTVHRIRLSAARISHSGPAPGLLFAFADGILNPKPY